MRLFRKLRALFRREKLDAEMAEEMRAHLEMQAAENECRGLAPDEARYAARRQFGGVEQIKERARDARGWLWLEQAAQDLRHAARALRRQPGFTLVAVATLALGLGATTALFSVVNTVWWRPLPFREPERLVRVWDTNAKRGLTDFSASVPNLVSWREAARDLEEFAAWRYGSATVVLGGTPEQVEVTRITVNLLPLLGLRPIAGRGFLETEDRPGGARAAIISEQLWQLRFQRDPAVLGRVLRLDGVPHTIVGVAPPELEALAAGRIWIPQPVDPAREPRNEHWLRVVARLRPGASLAAAQREMGGIAAQLEKEFPDSNENWGVRLESFHDWIVPATVRQALLVLFGAVACVLLIAAANLSNLLLVRAVARGREIAMRAALGAGRGRIVRQFATEAALLVTLGGGAGWLLAGWAVDVLRWLRPGNLPRLDELQLDGAAVLFAVGAALVTAVIVSVLPAWQAARLDLQLAMKEGAGVWRRGLAQGGLVVAQVALSAMLLIGATLLAQSFMRLQKAPLGFEPDRAQVFRLSLDETRYRAGTQRAAFQRALVERIAELPGVSAAGVTNAVPFDAAVNRFTSRIAGRASALPEGEMLSVERFNVGAGTFRALGVALRAGRFFDERDGSEAPPVVILNEAAARRLWPGDDPIGKTVIWNRPYAVVGVVADARNIAFDRPAQPAIFLSATQSPLLTTAVVVRTGGEAAGLVPAVRRVAAALDPELALFDVRPLTELLGAASARPRFNTGLLAAFAAVALLLAVVGLYGITAYGVERRQREFGVRMALGASVQAVRRLALERGVRYAVLGICTGVLLALGLAQLLRGLLHEVSATDWPTYAGVAALLFVVSLVASWLPARRAARVDPMVALRAE